VHGSGKPRRKPAHSRPNQVPISRLSTTTTTTTTPLRAAQEPQKQIAPASTVLFVEKNSKTPPLEEANIPPDKHYVDLTTPETVVMISQPRGLTNAVLGSIMAVRMRVLGAKGVVVDGRVRDLEELGAVGLSVCYRYSYSSPWCFVFAASSF
jgi:regulator of RNase E activity RraA